MLCKTKQRRPRPGKKNIYLAKGDYNQRQNIVEIHLLSTFQKEEICSTSQTGLLDEVGETVKKRKLTWSWLWNMESNSLSIIHSTYVLPSPTNLNLWLRVCSACQNHSNPQIHLCQPQDQPNPKQIHQAEVPGSQTLAQEGIYH